MKNYFFPHLPLSGTLLQSSHTERASDLSLADPQGIHQQRDLAPSEIRCHAVGTQSSPEGNSFSAIERRLASMVHLRSFPVNHKEMADAGLFYDEDSRVFRCYACSFVRSEQAWSRVDNPFHIHNTMSPGCPQLESAMCHQSDARNTRDRVMEDVTHSTDDNPHRLRVLSDLRSSYNQDSPRDSGFDEENIDSGELPGLPITSLDEREDSTELNRHNGVSHNSEGKPHGKRTAEE